jgi:uncharacterized protein YecE (DUF72 family)
VIKIGTSGYSYADWVGPFYPAGTKPNRMLALYARSFDCVELNYTYYRMPQARQLERMVESTGGLVDFAVKAHQDITHAHGSINPATCKTFLDSLSPLRERGVLAAVLFQFPFSFQATPDNRARLGQLAEATSGWPGVVEFRHRGWLSPETFEMLRNNALGFCCVDEPRLPGLLPALSEVTSSVGYVRFHGRNAGQWWKHEHAWQRYHYLYSEAELREWLEPLRSMEQRAAKVYLFSNNHYQGNAATNARMMKDLLGQKPRGDKADDEIGRQMSLDLSTLEE